MRTRKVTGWLPIGSPVTDGNRWKVRVRCGCGEERDVLCGVDGKLKHRGRCWACWAKGHDKHGAAKPESPDFALYRIWQGIKDRCHNPRNPGFHNYGGRGIVMYEGWRSSFTAFREAVGPRPSPDLELDREDNEKGYEPGNVRWATHVVNQNNKRTNHSLTHGGMTLTISEWARRVGCKPNSLLFRIRSGMSVEQALTIPFGDPSETRRLAGKWKPHGKPIQYIDYGGESLTAEQWGRRVGLSRQVIGQRIWKLGWTVERALTVGASRPPTTINES